MNRTIQMWIFSALIANYSRLYLILAINLIYLSSCTYNISIAHTEGTATDVIDDNATPTSTVSPTITGIPGV